MFTNVAEHYCFSLEVDDFLYFFDFFDFFAFFACFLLLRLLPTHLPSWLSFFPLAHFFGTAWFSYRPVFLRGTRSRGSAPVGAPWAR